MKIDYFENLTNCGNSKTLNSSKTMKIDYFENLTNSGISKTLNSS